MTKLQAALETARCHLHPSPTPLQIKLICMQNAGKGQDDRFRRSNKMILMTFGNCGPQKNCSEADV